MYFLKQVLTAGYEIILVKSESNVLSQQTNTCLKLAIDTIKVMGYVQSQQ